MTEIEAFILGTKMHKAAYEAIAPFYETIFDNSLAEDDVQIWLPTKEGDKNRAEITFLPNKSPVYEEERFNGEIEHKLYKALRDKGFHVVRMMKKRYEGRNVYGSTCQYVMIEMIMMMPMIDE